MRWPNRQDHAEATVGARQTTVVPLEVSSLLRHRGSGPRSLYFDVTATLVKPPGPKVQTQAQFDVLPERLGPGRLLEQTWTRRLLLAIGAVILVALLFDVSGLLRPVVVIAVAPLIGGILLRSVWWIVLYPLGLAAVLVAAGQEVVRDAFNISAPRPSWAELGPPGDYLNDVFAAINYLTPNDIQERLTQESLGLFDPQLSYIRSCELGRDFGSQRELCTTADWNILVLAALCALIGTMLGKLVFRRPDVPTC